MEGWFEFFNAAQLHYVRWGLLAVAVIFAAIVLCTAVFAAKELKDDIGEDT